MISLATAEKLLHACACHMRTNDVDAFTIVCASCEDGVMKDPDELTKEMSTTGKAPEWFTDTCVAIITGRIPLVDFPVIEKKKTLFDED